MEKSISTRNNGFFINQNQVEREARNLNFSRLYLFVSYGKQEHAILITQIGECDNNTQGVPVFVMETRLYLIIISFVFPAHRP